MIYRRYTQQQDVKQVGTSESCSDSKGVPTMFSKSAIALAISASVASGALAADKLDWTSFAPEDRASCLKSTRSTGAYTHLIKCLEAKRADRSPPD
jgi:hypothetical protein